MKGLWGIRPILQMLEDQQSSKQSSERPSERSSKRRSERAIERAIEQAIERAIEHRAIERATEWPSDRAMERTSDRATRHFVLQNLLGACTGSLDIVNASFIRNLLVIYSIFGFVTGSRGRSRSRELEGFVGTPPSLVVQLFL